MFINGLRCSACLVPRGPRGPRGGPVGPVGGPRGARRSRGKNNKTRMHVHYIRPKISLCDPASRGRNVAPTGSAHEGSPEAPGEAGRMRGGLCPKFSSPRVPRGDDVPFAMSPWGLAWAPCLRRGPMCPPRNDVGAGCVPT